MVMHKADRLFKEEQKQKIVQATREAETRTTGEIVVIVANTSGNYYDLKAASALGLSAVMSLLVCVSLLHVSLWNLLTLTAVFFPLSFLYFSRAQAVTLDLAPTRRIEGAVRNAALREFYEHGIDETKGHTGVLFYISLLERRVFVLADKGIYEKITQQVLDRYVSEVATGIKAGRACEALIKAIAGIGELLAAHFPGLPDDSNELPDSVLSDTDQ
ncbi:MAG: TPM domain-containing protein [Nitrospirae bacterium]|nr:TPM domain-containing protein [Nitrospirota bacterium]